MGKCLSQPGFEYQRFGRRNNESLFRRMTNDHYDREEVCGIDVEFMLGRVELQDDCVLVNSIGHNVSCAFRGKIAKGFKRKFGKNMTTQTLKNCKQIYNTTKVKGCEIIPNKRNNENEYIVHCICPRWSENDRESKLLRIFKEIWTFCMKNEIKSVAIPPLSTGFLSLLKIVVFNRKKTNKIIIILRIN